MNYYTSTIPLPLAEKLKEKGINIPSISKYIIGNQVRHYDRDYDGDMPIIGTREYRDGDLIKFSRIDEECNPMCCNAPTYAEVFDWLMSDKRITIVVEPSFYEPYLGKVYSKDGFLKGFDGKTWHETAEKAIEEALELI